MPQARYRSLPPQTPLWQPWQQTGGLDRSCVLNHMTDPAGKGVATVMLMELRYGESSWPVDLDLAGQTNSLNSDMQVIMTTSRPTHTLSGATSVVGTALALWVSLFSCVTNDTCLWTILQQYVRAFNQRGPPTQPHQPASN
ncbi:hypothetical protein VOLCADRAFT_94125 [Volvox carteri f. nagariensis]|uniref:Uncharacterized protein n=1 Tax=Volvox carteri f. nagariensis TaxID=3068 RepID=D8U3Z1_VOLCA|nr:uncharacterized protein VOLCADRAFT_94125 [Volvox carteri f. nagariensis]EFJ45615.1 hypothetical protein VOLCADRAFT_94125 [Volvox carteri f. nagariensis]|eukprot:XP_002953305.1 hypothetical protein VOLCADRAFT_94125 [Volvox carteri f. nagariensis]